MVARGVTDLRAVIAVRRAFRPVFFPNHLEHDPTRPDSGEEEGDPNVEVAYEESDTRDVGGDEGLTGDVSTMRMRRCFELVMKTGYVIRLEVRPFQTRLCPSDDERGRPGLPESP